MKRAAVYARYSTDLQNDQSVEDQIRLCQAHASRIGVTVVREGFDRAKSGASMFGRPGLADLIQSAERGEFEVLIAEAPDRISRDIADLAHVHKTLKFRGIEINCVNGGAMDTLQIGMYGVIGQMQREEGAKKVKRGMMGLVRAGRSAGGRAYGYEPVPGSPGELRIVEHEAAIIRRIFEMYSVGISPRTIAGTLNAEGIPAPRGVRWNASTINGNGERGYGILRNPLFDGRRVWNRVHMVKDPSTGRRISRANDEADLETADAPHLRIVPADLFEAVQIRKRETGGDNRHRTPRSKRLLSGLLRCGKCGSGMGLVGKDTSGYRVQCSRYRESTSCDHKRKYYIERIEDEVLNSLRLQFSDTSIIEIYVAAYQDEQKRIRSEALRHRGSAMREMQEAKDAITRVLEKIAQGLIEDDEAAVLLAPLRQKRDRNKAILEAIEEPANVIELQPKAVRRFRENIESLAKIVNQKQGEVSPELMIPFRQLVAAVVVQPTPAGQAYEINIKGYLASLVTSELSVIKVVAGGGLEPPTLGL